MPRSRPRWTLRRSISRSWRSGPRTTSSTARWPSARARPSGRSTRVRRRPTEHRERITSRPGCSRTCSRGSRPCAGIAWTARQGGTATACRWNSRSRRSSGSPARATSRPTGSRSSMPGAGSPSCAMWMSSRSSPSGWATGSTWTRPTGRWTRPTSRASGGRSSRSSTRDCSCRTTGSAPTARAAAPGCPTMSWPRATRTSSTRRCTSACRSRAAPWPSASPGSACWYGPPPPGPWCPTPPWRSSPTRATRWSG